MAALIDSACDICGQIHQLREDRVGESATCKACGTKFEVAEFIPVDEDEEEDVNHNPLDKVKSALSSILLLFVVAGLISLLFWHPGRQDQLMARPAAPQFVPSAPPANFRGQPANLHRREIFIPERAARGPARQVAEVHGTRRVTTNSRTSLRLTGRHFGGTTGVSCVSVSDLQNIPFHVLSDSEIEVTTRGVPAAADQVIVLQSRDGLAVVFTEDVPVVDAQHPFDKNRSSAKVWLVRSGGELISDQPVLALVEPGGRVDLRCVVFSGIIKRGTQFHATMAHELRFEDGLRLNIDRNRAYMGTKHPLIMFYRLPAGALTLAG